MECIAHKRANRLKAFAVAHKVFNCIVVVVVVVLLVALFCLALLLCGLSCLQHIIFHSAAAAA